MIVRESVKGELEVEDPGSDMSFHSFERSNRSEEEKLEDSPEVLEGDDAMTTIENDCFQDYPDEMFKTRMAELRKS